MDDNEKERLLNALPKNITIYSSMDYPDEGTAKIRGVTNKFGFTLDWHYYNDPDNIRIATMAIEDNGIEGVIPLDQLKDYLS
jgi:hypothetical protein